MHDQRRIRFFNLGGLTRRDLPLVCEVWLEDVQRSAWATGEAMVLAAYFMRYVMSPDPSMLLPWRMTAETRLEPDEAVKSLQMMKANFAIEAFSNEGGNIKVSLRLSVLQRLKVLEAKLRLVELHEALGIVEPAPGDGWVPEETARPSQSHDSGERRVVVSKRVSEPAN